MKYIFFILYLPFIALAGDAIMLETPHYIVAMRSNCPEYDMGAKDCVDYAGLSIKSGKSIELKGSPWYRMCADGETPCKFMGYHFKNGNIDYYVTEAGRLLVKTDKDKVLVDEKGKWLNIDEGYAEQQMLPGLLDKVMFRAYD
ncbi:MAG: hypothetical protein CSA47_00265 [Gammaproteobacteria bacterium]|nr:MAG: hypothetical protein CSA47_00265 [Gammaproteobacteria bacterium]